MATLTTCPLFYSSFRHFQLYDLVKRDKIGLNRERNLLKLGRGGIVWCQGCQRMFILIFFGGCFFIIVIIIVISTYSYVTTT